MGQLVKVKIEDARLWAARKIKEQANFLSPKQLETIVSHYIDADLRGKSTHGLRKLTYDIQFYGDRLSAPTIIKERASLAFVEGNNEIGPLAAQYCSELAIKNAQQYGSAIVGLRHSQRFGMLSTWTEMISAAGLVGIVTNTSEPFAAIYGSSAGVLGTNPLSISLAAGPNKITLDTTMTKSPMSLVWQNLLLGIDLPEKQFYDSTGHYTQEPKDAVAVDTLGEWRGSGISFMLQLFTGPMLGLHPQLSKSEPYEVGFYFQAFDPTFFTSKEDLEKAIQNYIAYVKKVPPKEGFDAIYLPGERGKNKLDEAIKAGWIELPASVNDWLQS